MFAWTSWSPFQCFAATHVSKQTWPASCWCFFRKAHYSLEWHCMLWCLLSQAQCSAWFLPLLCHYVCLDQLILIQEWYESQRSSLGQTYQGEHDANSTFLYWIESKDALTSAASLNANGFLRFLDGHGYGRLFWKACFRHSQSPLFNLVLALITHRVGWSNKNTFQPTPGWLSNVSIAAELKAFQLP